MFRAVNEAVGFVLFVPCSFLPSVAHVIRQIPPGFNILNIFVKVSFQNGLCSKHSQLTTTSKAADSYCRFCPLQTTSKPGPSAISTPIYSQFEKIRVLLTYLFYKF